MGIGTILYYVVGLGSLICWILVLVRMFKESVLKGLLGLICGLYAFIWGWMNAGTGLRNIMLIWTVLIILAIILGYTTGAGIPSMPKI
jgi:hypothetical protein